MSGGDPTPAQQPAAGSTQGGLSVWWQRSGAGTVAGSTAAELATGGRQMAGLTLEERMCKRPKIGFNSLVQSQKYVTV